MAEALIKCWGDNIPATEERLRANGVKEFSAGKALNIIAIDMGEFAYATLHESLLDKVRTDLYNSACNPQVKIPAIDQQYPYNFRWKVNPGKFVIFSNSILNEETNLYDKSNIGIYYPFHQALLSVTSEQIRKNIEARRNWLRTLNILGFRNNF